MKVVRLMLKKFTSEVSLKDKSHSVMQANLKDEQKRKELKLRTNLIISSQKLTLKPKMEVVKPWPNVKALPGRHFEFYLSNIPIHLTTKGNID